MGKAAGTTDKPGKDQPKRKDRSAARHSFTLCAPPVQEGIAANVPACISGALKTHDAFSEAANEIRERYLWHAEKRAKRAKTRCMGTQSSRLALRRGELRDGKRLARRNVRKGERYLSNGSNGRQTARERGYATRSQQ